jgi:hypothetical protein
MKSLLTRKSRAQGMVEYIIIVVVVGIFCIGIFMALGKGVQSQVGISTEKLTGLQTHNATLDTSDVSTRVSTETARTNTMKGE